MRICTAAQMQAIDARTIHEIGIPGIVLMERAGLAVCRVVRERFPGAERIFVVCGSGNNGGDGFVAARELARRGLTVRVFLLARAERLKGDALTNLRILEKLGASIRTVERPADLRLKDEDDVVHHLEQEPAAVGAFYSDGRLGFHLENDEGLVYWVETDDLIGRGCKAR